MIFNRRSARCLETISPVMLACCALFIFFGCESRSVPVVDFDSFQVETKIAEGDTGPTYSVIMPADLRLNAHLVIVNSACKCTIIPVGSLPVDSFTFSGEKITSGSGVPKLEFLPPSGGELQVEMCFAMLVVSDGESPGIEDLKKIFPDPILGPEATRQEIREKLSTIEDGLLAIDSIVGTAIRSFPEP